MKIRFYPFISILLLLSCVSCSSNTKHQIQLSSNTDTAKTLQTRFQPPFGFERILVAQNSFAAYLRSLPLKPAGSKVKYHNGKTKQNNVYEAVVDMELGTQDLQQCADAIIRLRGEYFYAEQHYDKISFNLTNGFKVDYATWIKGNRVAVKGNHTFWQKTATPANTYRTFRNYMDFIFTYAGTLSLAKSLKSKKAESLEIGDVFIVGGSPGHAVIVVDLAKNKEGKKAFILAQSYMPAQDTQILKNPSEQAQSPWYILDTKNDLITPEWTFTMNELKTW